MAQFSPSTPSMHDIGVAQDSNRNLRRQEAKDRFYKIGNRWHFWGASTAIILALASPLVLVYEPDWGPLLGAIAGVWIFMSRLLFEPLKQGCQVKGASAQEMFDCDVLGLTWNDALIRQPSEEEIRSASKRFKDPKSTKKHCGWYPTDIDIAWPRSVITCQRSNTVWARRQHHAYGCFLLVSAFVWAIFGVIIALVQQATLAGYLTTVALPSLPAVLDAVDLSKKHFLASSRRQHLEDETNAMFDKNDSSHEALREIQDQIFDLRRDAPPVAGWFYWILSKTYEEDMRYAAKERAGRD
ncbi:S-4TM family putative pore-forming effector [Acidithrix sp. C25]|uniref:S-4TM family putative pore-forming effector n=1 Tax=Acidithrix sp. C25 TaxID=1671482 RepID=UPI00191BC639|nr:S-4TM family putative pore-forming effector [Acidithrix sp. C25]CAG4927411.1 unnamed protein product [Acidithrix sp. C25]